MLAVALRGAGEDALLGEAAHLGAQQLLILGEGEIDAGGFGGRSRGLGQHSHGKSLVFRPC